MSNLNWKIDPPLDGSYEVGKSYMVDFDVNDGRFWASGIITITEKWFDEDCGGYCYGFTLDTLVDGSPGILDGFDNYKPQVTS